MVELCAALVMTLQNMEDQKNYKELARLARRKIISMIHKAQTSHVASNLSCIDIATVLYENLQEGDKVVWSAGWKAATIYYFLAQQKQIPDEDLEKFPHAPYLGLAEPGVRGVFVAGGAMGHGLPVAVGMALAKKKAEEKGIVYCIMSDGEMNEGTTWECAAFAAHHKLTNLIILIDANKWQAMGRTSDVLNIHILNAFKGFDWYIDECDGHDYRDIEDAIKNCEGVGPNVIVCNTIKGSGGDTACDIFEQGLLYHYKHVDEETYRKATELLSQKKMHRMP